MRNNNKRGLLATAGALVTAAALALGGAVAANAAPAQPVPESTPVTITKLAQPETLGAPATGEQIADLNDYTGIGGVVFEYFLVPGIDLSTNAGQQAAGALTLAQALLDIDDDPTGTFDPTHNPTGVTTATLDRGVYVIKEDPASVPAGVTASAPFLLAVPLTDPTDLNAWLDHIYVYPKNSQITGEKSVENADQLVVGDDVTWTIAVDVPRVANPAYDSSDPDSDQFIATDYFRIDDTLNVDELGFVSATVSVGGTALAAPGDYAITPVNVLQDPSEPEDADTNPVVAITHQILFTEDGRQKLADAVNADATAQVTVELVTTVLKADEITNSASVFPNQDSVSENTPIVIPGTDVRYGSADFFKLSSNEDLEDLSGAVFQLYTTRAAAESLNQDYRVTPTDDEGAVQTEWTTEEDGTFSIEGLRYSGYADGQSFDDTDPRYQTYWLVEVVALDGHQLLAQPLELTITGDRTADGFGITNQENTGGFVLPLTGGMGTMFLTIAGIAILATVLLVARRRRDSEFTAAE